MPAGGPWPPALFSFSKRSLMGISMLGHKQGHTEKRCGATIPERAGVGFKPEHAQAIETEMEPVAWFEVHPENYMVAGGPRLAMLEALRADYPLSMHGVGLSLGGHEPLDKNHLKALRNLVDRFEPGLVSEHIAWSSHDGLYLADLLPTPLDDTSLGFLVAAIDETQDALGRRILIENPTSYFALPDNSMSEIDFISQAARRSGCGLLIDVNNIYISARNLGFDAKDHVDALPGELIGEIHLGGHEADAHEGEALLIDTHSRPVANGVWALYQRLIGRIGARPTLIEWDNDIPDWSTLRDEARRADALLSQAAREKAA